MDWFAPSFPVLWLKAVLIYAFCWLAGWSVIPRRLVDHFLTDWILTCCTGAAWLNLSVILVSFAGFPGRVGLVLLLAALLVRMVIAGIASARVIIVVTVLTVLSALSYLAPFVILHTSGFYSRGGGDHSTYISLSDWFVSHRLWDSISDEETLPPHPYHEVYAFLKKRQQFHGENVQPLADQYVAAPFMALLPGSVEETYTAAVAVYLTLAGWSVVVFLFRLGMFHDHEWLWSAPLVLFSNLLLYIATCHSIPALVAVFLLYSALTILLHLIRKDEWDTAKVSHLLPLTLLTGALLDIYPHLFLLGTIFVGLMFYFHASTIRFKPALKYMGWCGLGSLLLANLSLLIIIPLLLFSTTRPGGALQIYSWLEVISVQMGIVDFGMYFDRGAPTGRWIIIGCLGGALLAVFVYRAIQEFPRRARDFLLSLILIYLAGTLYYLPSLERTGCDGDPDHHGAHGPRARRGRARSS